MVDMIHAASCDNDLATILRRGHVPPDIVAWESHAQWLHVVARIHLRSTAGQHKPAKEWEPNNAAEMFEWTANAATFQLAH